MSALLLTANHFVSSVAGYDRLVEVPASDVTEFRKATASMQKRALRLGCEPISLQEVAVFQTMKSVTVATKSQERTFNVPVPMHVFAFKGGMPKLPEAYALQGVVTFVKGGAVISAVPGEEIPVEYRTGVNHCDHCNKVRPRNGAVLVRHIESGKTLQVGGQCVKDFLGTSLDRFIAGFEFRDWTFVNSDSEDGGFCGSKRQELPTDLYLAAVCCAVRENGFRSSNEERSTKTTADTIMHNVLLKKDPEDYVHPEDVDYQEAESLKTKALEILNEDRILSDFEWNMKLGLNSEVLIEKTMGVLAAISKLVYGRKLKTDVATDKPVSKYVGTVGDKVTLTLTYIKEVSFDSQWGTTHIRLFQDEQGNSLVWKTSTGFWMKDVQIHEGMTVKVKATIKGHGLYNDTQQTELTRLKVESIVGV